jgi:hypothetical protein
VSMRASNRSETYDCVVEIEAGDFLSRHFRVCFDGELPDAHCLVVAAGRDTMERAAEVRRPGHAHHRLGVPS